MAGFNQITPHPPLTDEILRYKKYVPDSRVFRALRNYCNMPTTFYRLVSSKMYDAGYFPVKCEGGDTGLDAEVRNAKVDKVFHTWEDMDGNLVLSHSEYVHSGGLTLPKWLAMYPRIHKLIERYEGHNFYTDEYRQTRMYKLYLHRPSITIIRIPKGYAK